MSVVDDLRAQIIAGRITFDPPAGIVSEVEERTTR